MKAIKKQRLITIIFLLLIGCAAVLTVACTPKKQKLATPQNLKIEELDFSWDEVEGAAGYLVGVNNDEYEVKDNRFDLINLPDLGEYKLEVQALGDGKKYLDSSWSEKKKFKLEATEGLSYKLYGPRNVKFQEKNIYEVSAFSLDVSGVLVIPPAYNGLPVLSVDMNRLKNITDIWMPSTIAYIQKEAFCGCDNLKRIKIPKSVKEIGGVLFCNDINLERIEVDEGNEAFIGENNCLIRKSDKVLIAGCKNSVIPDYVKAIDEYVFRGHENLTKINIPDAVESIGEMAFYSTSLLEITLPEGLKSVGNLAFCNNALTKLGIPAGMEEIAEGAFGNNVFNEITVAEGNKAFKMYSNCLIRLADNTALYGENVEELIIPDYVTDVGMAFGVFGGPKTLRVVIPESVKNIYGRFSACVNIKSFVLAGEIRKMNGNIFNNCTIYSTQEDTADWIAFPGTSYASGRYDGQNCVTVFGCTVKYDGIYPYVYSVEPYSFYNEVLDRTFSEINVRNQTHTKPKMTANPPERQGYTFGGWTTEEGGTTAEYSAAEIEKIPGDKTIYAIWIKD